MPTAHTIAPWSGETHTSGEVVYEPPLPFVDLQRQYATIREEVRNAIQRVLEHNAFISGPEVEAFETAFAQYCGVRHCIGVNSGTSALHLALIACGVGAGDEVITVPMTFIATCWAISYVGATPVFVDVEPVTCTMDVEQIERVITPRTRAILPVHLYGQTADMAPLLELCARYGLVLIEDAAQAHGALYRGRYAGGIGQVGCFSFYPGKNLGAYGEAGAITTNDDAIAARLRSLRDHAQTTRYHHQEIGFNYRMDGIQGAILRLKLQYLDDWNTARRHAATQYHTMLRDTSLILPAEGTGRYHVWHLYVIRHTARDQLQQALTHAGITTGRHYPVPLHLQPAYAHLGYRSGDFPVTEQIARQCLSLPIYAELSETQQTCIAQVLQQTLGDL